MAVMMVPTLLVVSIGVTTFAAFMLPSIRKGHAGADKHHKSCNRQYFQNVGFHGDLLFPLNLPRLDGATAGRVYKGKNRAIQFENFVWAG
jgi:hypothetical protein